MRVGPQYRQLIKAVKASIRALKALFYSLNLGSLSKSEMGVTTVLFSGTNCRRYPLTPSSTRTSSTAFGFDSINLARGRPGAKSIHDHADELHNRLTETRFLEIDG